MAELHNIPTRPADKSSGQGSAWAEANAQLGGFSVFHEFPPLGVFLGFGPENGEMDLSAFWNYGPVDTGWGGDFPTEEQPTFPEVPAYLQGPRR